MPDVANEWENCRSMGKTADRSGLFTIILFPSAYLKEKTALAVSNSMHHRKLSLTNVEKSPRTLAASANEKMSTP